MGEVKALDYGAKAAGEISGYGIGPFQVDVKTNSVTLAPGTYVLSKPIVFTLSEETAIEGVDYRGSVNHDAEGAILDDAVSDRDVAG